MEQIKPRGVTESRKHQLMRGLGFKNPEKMCEYYRQFWGKMFEKSELREESEEKFISGVGLLKCYLYMAEGIKSKEEMEKYIDEKLGKNTLADGAAENR